MFNLPRILIKQYKIYNILTKNNQPPISFIQVLQQRLENSTRSKNYLIKQLDKSKDDIDDLKFQVNSSPF